MAAAAGDARSRQVNDEQKSLSFKPMHDLDTDPFGPSQLAPRGRIPCAAPQPTSASGLGAYEQGPGRIRKLYPLLFESLVNPQVHRLLYVHVHGVVRNPDVIDRLEQ
jgi:hypothetical protein